MATCECSVYSRLQADSKVKFAAWRIRSSAAGFRSGHPV